MDAVILICCALCFVFWLLCNLYQPIDEPSGTKIIDVRPVLLTKGSCILVGLEITFVSCRRLTFLTIEKFTNQTYETFKIPNPMYNENNKNILFLDEWRKCEKSVSYRVILETAYNKDTSEKLSVYILKAPVTNGVRPGYYRPQPLRNATEMSDISSSKSTPFRDRKKSKHIGTQTLYTSLRKKEESEEILIRFKPRKNENEFTYINLEPEQCLRCSNFGFTKCSLCSAPYCSSRCRSKDFKEHKNQCPERRFEEQQRREKEQEYESCIKSLRGDIERLKDHGLCKICLEEEARVVFDPCGHLCCCDNCSLQLKACPMCRDDVQKSIKVFT